MGTDYRTRLFQGWAASIFLLKLTYEKRAAQKEQPTL